MVIAWRDQWYVMTGNDYISLRGGGSSAAAEAGMYSRIFTEPLSNPMGGNENPLYPPLA